MMNGWIFVRPEAVDTICAPAFALAMMLPQQLHERGLIRHSSCNLLQATQAGDPLADNSVHYDYPQDMLEKQECPFACD